MKFLICRLLCIPEQRYISYLDYHFLLLLLFPFAPTRIDVTYVRWIPKLIHTVYVQQSRHKQLMEGKNEPKQVKNSITYCVAYVNRIMFYFSFPLRFPELHALHAYSAMHLLTFVSLAKVDVFHPKISSYTIYKDRNALGIHILYIMLESKTAGRYSNRELVYVSASYF